jgi:hypothetical protein
MAVFVAASDETSGGNVFSTYHYSGWVMSEDDWSRFFTPAWQEWVLNGPPKIPYLHMTEMRSKAWREKWGITARDADIRLDNAALVIDQMGSLFPIDVSIDGSIFRPLYEPHKLTTTSGAVKEFQPDFFAFLPYVYTVLGRVHARNPEAEKIDFLVENNGEITKHIHEFYRTMPEALAYIKANHLIPLLGELLPAGKDRVPLQAADYLCWHARRARAQTLTDRRDLRRWGTISDRKGLSIPIPTDIMISGGF